MIFTKGLSKALSNQIIDFIESSGFDLSWCIYALDQWIVTDRSDRRIQREESIVRAVSSEGKVNTAHADEINKILCICNPERILSIEKQLCRAFPMCSIAKSSDILLEIMEKGINKETGVRTLCGKWGIPVENALPSATTIMTWKCLRLLATAISWTTLRQSFCHGFHCILTITITMAYITL